MSVCVHVRACVAGTTLAIQSTKIADCGWLKSQTNASNSARSSVVVWVCVCLLVVRHESVGTLLSSDRHRYRRDIEDSPGSEAIGDERLKGVCGRCGEFHLVDVHI